MEKGKCKHFNGTINKVCSAGVSYQDVTPEGGDFYSIPCLNQLAHCDKRLYPTQEEIEEEDRMIGEMVGHMVIARKAITDYLDLNGLKGQSVGGNIDCPHCNEEKALHFTYAGSYNGHIHAKCKNGCASWIE